MKLKLNMILTAAILIMAVAARSQTNAKRWTEIQAQRWQTENGWLRGGNFNPSMP